MKHYTLFGGSDLVALQFCCGRFGDLSRDGWQWREQNSGAAVSKQGWWSYSLYVVEGINTGQSYCAAENW